jgi:SRSO17 transposase
VESALAKLDQHFTPYRRHFESRTRSTAQAAKHYLCGLYQSGRANLERMADCVADSDYQRMHHMLSVSAFDRLGVYRQLIQDANAHMGYGGTALVIDESGFAKKGEHSAGVARQWNGRLGKTDNCQVGVFAALTKGEVATLIDAQLYLPQDWIDDPKRCEAAHIPEEARVFRTKGEIALEMIRQARYHGLHYDWISFDGGYGHLPWLLRALDDERETFLAEVHSDQVVYLADPAPSRPPRKGRGRQPMRCVSEQTPAGVADWAAAQPASAWRKMELRNGEKGKVMAEFLHVPVFVWDGVSPDRRGWHLLVRRELDGKQLKFCLSNARPDVSLRHLVDMQASRHFVERAFEDAKSACGMADYQVRGWQGWHQHMSLVMIAMMFLTKERLACRDTHRLLSCKDIVAILRHKLPSKVQCDDDLVLTITDRHRRRHQALKSAYGKQDLEPPAEFGELM